MKKELDLYLVEKYPKIFKDRYGDKTKTAMYWGFDHDDGWFWLLDQLCNSIQSYIDGQNKWNNDKISQVVATQVKEKYGGLNFYYSGGDSYIDGMVSMAESMSYNICEKCGSIKEIGYTTGWIKTICKECWTNNPQFNGMWKEKETEIEYSQEDLRKIKLDKINLDNVEENK